ncbi:hypothetical protein ABG067_007571 [Albugo candida]
MIHCHSYLHRGIQHDLAATTEAVIKQQENVTSKYLSSHEKIINTIVESVHLPLQKFKNKIMSMTLTLKKYENKQKLRKNLHEANDWLKEYKSEVIPFNLIDSTWSPQNRIRQEEYVDLRMKYDNFILIKYNQICNALVIYEDDCGEKYRVFVETLQAKCDQVNKLLKFTASIQQHQKDVLVFMNSAEKHKKKLVNVKNQQELLHWQDEAKVVYKELFSCISWPTMLESPHGKIMYKYSTDILVYLFTPMMLAKKLRLLVSETAFCGQDAFFMVKAGVFSKHGEVDSSWVVEGLNVSEECGKYRGQCLEKKKAEPLFDIGYFALPAASPVAYEWCAESAAVSKNLPQFKIAGYVDGRGENTFVHAIIAPFLDVVISSSGKLNHFWANVSLPAANPEYGVYVNGVSKLYVVIIGEFKPKEVRQQFENEFIKSVGKQMKIMMINEILEIGGD